MDTTPAIFLGIACSAAAVQDVRRGKIPNLITFPTMAAGIVCHSVMDGVHGLFFGLGGLAFGISLLIFPYWIGKAGAGDAKLMGAAGAVIGPKGVLVAFVITTLAGGIYALIVLLLQRRYLQGLGRRIVSMVKTFAVTAQIVYVLPVEAEKAPHLRYGVAIAFGTITFLFLEFLGYHFPMLPM
jgi:prepilin peptidase CpaA